MKRLAFSLLLALTAAACAGDSIPVGDGLTPAGNGPKIVFDLLRRPLPEIPQPNDVATVADPSSRTGRRINVSHVAPTRLETAAREGFTDMEGWGTYQPITVAFERPSDIPEGDPAIDIARVAARMKHDGHDFADDPIYVVNLKTGVPVPLDMSGGDFPTSVVDKTKYFANDPRAAEENLVFETVDESHGLLPSQYQPALDTDFDGVLDRPNTLGPAIAPQKDGIDNLLTFYERESDTLIMRPVLPLDEMTEYAVVVTDRLKDENGRPVRSPFEYIHHSAQRDTVQKVRAAMNDRSHAAYFGDLAGTGTSHVAFTWSFTTQPVMDDMRVLRDGLSGVGPMAYLAHDYPTTVTAFRAIGQAAPGSPDAPGWEKTKSCLGKTDRPYIVRVAQARDVLDQFFMQVAGFSPSETARLEQSLENVDYFVIGEFQSPYFMGDPAHEDPDGRFQVNYKTGEARVQPDTVPFWLSVPKATTAHKQPFPTTVWAHGTTLHGDEILARAGYFAKQGVAMIGIDMPGHGLYLNRGLTNIAKVALGGACMVPWIEGITASRAHDLNGDGVPDSGGLLWSAHIFHSRDNIRQSVVDMMQTTRVLASFNGQNVGAMDYDGDGKNELAGDFNADGVPDVGGATSVYSAGNSFGGVLALVHGAVDHRVTATASISGGGGLTDIATRSSLVPESVLEQVLSPLVVAVPAKERTQTGPSRNTRCTGDQRSVRFVLNDLTNSRELEVACLTPAELLSDMTVVLTNATNKEVRCARTGDLGRFRIPIPATIGDALHVEVFREKDLVDSYKTCKLPEASTPIRKIDTFEQAGIGEGPIPEGAPTCDDTVAANGLPDGTGCAQFRGLFYPVGYPLVAPQEGLGLRRQSPEFRRLISLTQAAVDPSDPVNFAAYYYQKRRTAPDGTPVPPRAVMEFNTTGDPLVPTATGYAFARASGAVPIFSPQVGAKYPEYANFTAPDKLYASLGGITPDDLLARNFAFEGLARLGRSQAGAACEDNRVPASATCPGGPQKSPAFCSRALPDVDYLAEGKNQFDAPHPDVPLRLVRSAALTATDASTLAIAWAPRLAGVPFTADPKETPLTAPLIGVINAYNNPLGQHVWVNGDSCKAFDDAVYYDHLLIRFLATGGTDAYFLSHPASHRCLENESCGFFGK
jgi:hypothetical protein